MKKMLFGLIAIMLLINFSCNSDKLSENMNENKKLSKFLELNPKKLAEEHNIALRKINNQFKKISKNSVNNILTTSQIYDNLMDSEVGLDSITKIEVYDYIAVNNNVDTNMNYIISHLNSINSKNLYLSINNQLTNAPDYASIVKVLNSGSTLVNNGTFTAFDKQVLNIFIETCKSSAYYWYIENNPSQARIMPDWVRKDGNGIAQASVGWAIGAGIFGGGPATYFVACGVGGALASIWP